MNTFLELSPYLPFAKELSSSQQVAFTQHTHQKKLLKNQSLHAGKDSCLGFVIVKSGRLRIFTRSFEGKEITLYRLHAYDCCLFSAACMFKGVQFEIELEANEDTIFYQIEPDFYQQCMKENLAVANYTNEVLAERFSDVMQLLSEILYQKIDVRIVKFLLEESNLQENDTIEITHESIAQHLGSAREVISRMLKYLEKEEYIKLKRGSIVLSNKQALEKYDLPM